MIDEAERRENYKSKKNLRRQTEKKSVEILSDQEWLNFFAIKIMLKAKRIPIFFSKAQNKSKQPLQNGAKKY